MGNDKNRKNFFKKHLTNEKSGCIIRHIKGNGVFKFFYLTVPFSHFNKEKGKGVFRNFTKGAFSFFQRRFEL